MVQLAGDEGVYKKSVKRNGNSENNENNTIKSCKVKHLHLSYMVVDYSVCFLGKLI